MSKFNFNEKFLASLNEILDKREAHLRDEIQTNYAHVDEVHFNEDIETDLENMKEIINQSELEYFNCSDFVQRDEILDSHSKEDLLTRIKELEDDRKELENDNRELKERLLTIENFLLKTLKGFKDD